VVYLTTLSAHQFSLTSNGKKQSNDRMGRILKKGHILTEDIFPQMSTVKKKFMTYCSQDNVSLSFS